MLEDARAGGLGLRAVREAVDLHGPPEAELRPAGVDGRLRVGGEFTQRLVLRRGRAHAADGRVEGAVALLEQLLDGARRRRELPLEPLVRGAPQVDRAAGLVRQPDARVQQRRVVVLDQLEPARRRRVEPLVRRRHADGARDGAAQVAHGRRGAQVAERRHGALERVDAHARPQRVVVAVVFRRVLGAARLGRQDLDELDHGLEIRREVDRVDVGVEFLCLRHCCFCCFVCCCFCLLCLERLPSRGPPRGSAFYAALFYVACSGGSVFSRAIFLLCCWLLVF